MSDGHLLHLFDEGLDDLTWELVHPDDCPPVFAEAGTEFEYTTWECGFELEVSHVGNDTMEPWPTEPGHYPIEFWMTAHHHYEHGPEFSAGISVGDKIGT